LTATLDGLDAPRIDLDHRGVDERRWTPVLGALPSVDIDTLARRVGAGRLVVVAPHPDDETLGVGGCMAAFAAAGGDVLVVSVTDGEAAPVSCTDLPAVRRRELSMAVDCLAPSARIERLGLPDGVSPSVTTSWPRGWQHSSAATTSCSRRTSTTVTLTTTPADGPRWGHRP